ncbi:MAG: hypothetical protein R2810_05000 [Flavobacteriales bacterium]
MHHRRGITVERFLHIVLVSAIVVCPVLLNAVQDVLLPFVLALAIAYLMYPFVLRVQRVVRLALARLDAARSSALLVIGLVWLVADIITLEGEGAPAVAGRQVDHRFPDEQTMALGTRCWGPWTDELRRWCPPERRLRAGQKGRARVPEKACQASCWACWPPWAPSGPWPCTPSSS